MNKEGSTVDLVQREVTLKYIFERNDGQLS